MVWDSGCGSDWGRVSGFPRSQELEATQSQELEATHWRPVCGELNSSDKAKLLPRKVLGTCPDLIFLKQKPPRPPDKPNQD